MKTGITSEALLSAAEMVRPTGWIGHQENRYLRKVIKANRNAPIEKKMIRFGSRTFGVLISTRVEPNTPFGSPLKKGNRGKLYAP